MIIFGIVNKCSLKSKHSFNILVLLSSLFLHVLSKNAFYKAKNPPEAAVSLVESGGDDIFSDDETLGYSHPLMRFDRNVFAEF
jgi:hypothetical protein